MPLLFLLPHQRECDYSLITESIEEQLDSDEDDMLGVDDEDGEKEEEEE